jgi:hypothetical protein
MRLFTTGSTMPDRQAGSTILSRFPAANRRRSDASVCLQMTAAGIPQLENILVRFLACA